MPHPLSLLSLLLAAVLLFQAPAATASSQTELQIEALQALEDLFQQQPETRTLAREADSVLVFPRIVKAGFVVGGETGEGVLLRDHNPVGLYRTTGLSYGLQAGIQTYGYALFFMGNNAEEILNQRNGWEIGVGPTVTVVDQGFARKLSSTTLKDGIYAYVFGQKGLMAGVSLQGSRIKPLGN